MRDAFRHLLVSSLSAWLMLHAGGAHAAEPLPEYTVKAGYLYNFAMLTEWPDDSVQSSLNLCILGPDHFGSALDSLRGKSVNGHPIVIRFPDSADATHGCHILYITEGAPAEVKRLLHGFGAQPMLTVTGDAELAQSGVAILLRPNGQRLGFEIDDEAAQRSGLHLSARLLRLAQQREMR